MNPQSVVELQVPFSQHVSKKASMSQRTALELDQILMMLVMELVMMLKMMIMTMIMRWRWQRRCRSQWRRWWWRRGGGGAGGSGDGDGDAEVDDSDDNDDGGDGHGNDDGGNDDSVSDMLHNTAAGVNPNPDLILILALGSHQGSALTIIRDVDCAQHTQGGQLKH